MEGIVRAMSTTLVGVDSILRRRVLGVLVCKGIWLGKGLGVCRRCNGYCAVMQMDSLSCVNIYYFGGQCTADYVKRILLMTKRVVIMIRCD